MWCPPPVILITILVLCQVYFTAYKIYQSFKTSILDQVTKVYNRDEILRLFSKQASKFKGKSGGNMVMLKIENLNDLNIDPIPHFEIALSQ